VINEKHYLAALYSFTDFGPKRTDLLLNYFKSAEKVWQLKKAKLSEVGLRDSLVDKFVEYREKFDIASYIKRLDKLGIKFTTRTSKCYPENLKGLDGSPVVLYYRGTWSKNDENAVAIVGTRKMTSYGREVAEKFSTELASVGITIVSGLARGIDTIAHKSALSAGGRTIAVVASGLDNIYPPENASLSKMISENGVVFSEYPLGYPALPVNFPSRNRIVSGLAKAIIVVEGLKKSGTLLTASHAAAQGRTVFAVPGQITSVFSEAPHYLLQNGAKFAFSTKDILDELDLEVKVDKEKVSKILPGNPEEKKIFEILEGESLHLDEIARITQIDISRICSVIVSMRLKGMVKEVGAGVYKKI